MNPVLRASMGAAVCVAFAILRHAGPSTVDWAHVALLFAALVLVPLALDLFSEPEPARGATRLLSLADKVQFPAALALAVACWLPPGVAAALAVLPWMVVTAFLAGAGFARLQHGGLRRDLHLLAADIALMFSAVGGAWVLADRAGIRPLGFDPHIVALTAVHFHYAGLLLPVFAGLAQQQMWMSRLAARGVVGSVLGVPAVAIGITATQRGWNPGIEAGAGCGMALAGMAVGVMHVRLALEARWPWLPRVLIGITGVALFFAMVLAALYASRAFIPRAAWLGLPQMHLLHGTTNMLGVGLCGVLGWRLASRHGLAGPAV